jgi:hypothetical protein
VRLGRFYRDRGALDELAGCYTEDSRIKTTWFEGNGAEFAAASRGLAERGRHSSHLITPALRGLLQAPEWTRVTTSYSLARPSSSRRTTTSCHASTELDIANSTWTSG